VSRIESGKAYPAVETAFFKHVFTRYYARSIGFSYWRGRNDREVDIISDMEGTLVPFEVKYRPPAHTSFRISRVWRNSVTRTASSADM
jgi:predicted AAA+ superfamily ATPase